MIRACDVCAGRPLGMLGRKVVVCPAHQESFTRHQKKLARQREAEATARGNEDPMLAAAREASQRAISGCQDTACGEVACVHDLAAFVRQQIDAAVAEARREERASALWMIGILLRRLGGSVTVTASEQMTIPGGSIVERRDDPESRSVTLTLRARETGGRDDG